MPTVRLGLAQINPLVGALGENAEAISGWRRRAAAAEVDLLITPELALTGYPPEDLLLKEGFLRATHEALDGLVAETSPTALAVGTPVVAGWRGVELDAVLDGRPTAAAPSRAGAVANAVVVAASGEVAAVATKRLLPNYDVFDEQRYFRAGHGPLTLLDIGGAAVGVLICEDVWTSEGPIAEMARRGAALVVVANASPFARGRRTQREEMISQRARETGCVVAYVNMVGGQDELVFDGQSFVVNEHGAVIARAAAFAEELLVVDVALPERHVDSTASLALSPKTTAAAATVAEPLDELEEIYAALVTGTRDYVTKNGFTDVVLGLSGGIDSALVAVIAADAVRGSRVHGYALPSRYSSDHSVDDARELARRLDMSFTILPIDNAHRALAATLEPALGHAPRGVTDENLQSRVRSVLWMAISNATNALVLTTGNKSELATGYFTLYGDSAGGFAVIKDVEKTLVYELARWRNQSAIKRGEEPPIPDHVLEKPPSAELRPDQRDDQSLPPYDELDPLLALYVEGDATAEELVAAGHDAHLVERIVQLVDRSEYKRRQMAPGVRITSKSFGKDRRLPITNSFRPPSP